MTDIWMYPKGLNNSDMLFLFCFLIPRENIILKDFGISLYGGRNVH